MNIFYLSDNPVEAAKLHCDKHVVKMILETAQILTSVHHRHGNINTTYKCTHKNHPSTLWAGDSVLHYRWLQRLGIELCIEYTLRYGRVHKTQALLEGELAEPPATMPDNGWVPPPACMPDEYKVEDTIESYKNYYRGAKAHMAVWKYSVKPEFMSVTDES
jgi:hypothetical protein